jgi:protein gp37
MMDVFEDRPDLVAPRLRLWGLIDDTPQLDWLLLTKRPENIARMWPRVTVHDSTVEPRHERSMSLAEIGQPENVWLGASCSTQADLNRNVPQLRQCPAAIHFLSLEPLLEKVRIPWGMCEDMLPSIAWVIVGGESGPNARHFDLAWARSVRDQCLAAGVPFFFKQAGALAMDSAMPWQRSQQVRFKDRKGGDPDEWEPDLRVREFPNV